MVSVVPERRHGTRLTSCGDGVKIRVIRLIFVCRQGEEDAAHIAPLWTVYGNEEG